MNAPVKLLYHRFASTVSDYNATPLCALPELVVLAF